MVTAVVPLELFGGVLLLRCKHDGEGQRGGLEEVVIARRSLELLLRLCKLGGGE